MVASSAVAQRVQWQTLGTWPLLVIDLSHSADHAETLAAVALARQMSVAHHPRQIFTLTDVTGFRYNTTIVSAIRELAEHNKPYVAYGAVVGLSPMLRTIYELARRASGRANLKTFETRDEAMAWLATLTVPSE
jgi:hypothetical protein